MAQQIRVSRADIGSADPEHEIRRFQVWLSVILNDEGRPYYQGPCDGVARTKTRQAVGRFQVARGLARFPGAVGGSHGSVDPYGAVPKGSRTLQKILAAVPAPYDRIVRLHGTSHFFIRHSDGQRRDAIDRLTTDRGLSDIGRARLGSLAVRVDGMAELLLIRLDPGAEDTAMGRVLLGLADFVYVDPQASSLVSDDVFLTGMRALEPDFWAAFMAHNERFIELAGLRLRAGEPGRLLLEANDSATLVSVAGDGTLGEPAKITHVLVALSGAQFSRGSEDVGQLFATNIKDAFVRVARGVQARFDRPGEVLVTQPYASYVARGPGIVGVSDAETPIDFVKRHVSRDAEGRPTGKIVIYGYSWGGYDATDLAWELNGAGLPVDLLITIDATRGWLSLLHQRGKDEEAQFPESGWRDRGIPGNVRKYRNYIQPDSQFFTASRGVRNPAPHLDSKNVLQVTMRSNHSLIDDKTLDRAIKDILTALHGATK